MHSTRSMATGVPTGSTSKRVVFQMRPSIQTAPVVYHQVYDSLAGSFWLLLAIVSALHHSYFPINLGQQLLLPGERGRRFLLLWALWRCLSSAEIETMQK